MALGPQGSKTVWYQPPDNISNLNADDNSNIDPQLLNEPVTIVTPPRAQWERSFGNDADGLMNANPQGPNPTPGTQHGPKPSSASCDAIENAQKTVSRLSQKCSLTDTLMEIQRYVIFAFFYLL